MLSDIEARGKQADDDREALSQFVAGHSESVKIASTKMSEILRKAGYFRPNFADKISRNKSRSTVINQDIISLVEKDVFAVP